MNTKHTPGPWQEFGPGSPAIYGGDPVRRICVLDRQTGAPMDECYANARLIAAAPALADALQWALEQIEDDLDPCHQQAFAHAHAVLAQATESAT